MAYKYSTKIGDKAAKAVALALPISFKQSVEVCNFIRGKELAKAVALLESVANKKAAVPFRRFCKGGVGHKRGLGAARYPVNTSKEIIKVLKDVEANAQQKGLDVSGLVIRSLGAQKAPLAWHYGRHRRRRMKRAHIEVVVEEKEKKQPEKVKGKGEKK